MSYFNNIEESIVPYQRSDLKISYTDSVTGEVIEKDNPDVKPFEYISPEREKEINLLISQGYTMKSADDGTLQMIPPAPKTDEEIKAELRIKREPLLVAFDKWEKAVLRGRETDDKKIMQWYYSLLELEETAFDNIPERVQYYLQGATQC